MKKEVRVSSASTMVCFAENFVQGHLEDMIQDAHAALGAFKLPTSTVRTNFLLSCLHTLRID